MKRNKKRAYLATCILVVLSSLQARSQQSSSTSPQSASIERDGQHDFDPLIGSWKFHLKRRLHPLTGSTTWVELDGTGVCYKIWDGRADLDTVETRWSNRSYRRSDAAYL